MQIPSFAGYELPVPSALERAVDLRMSKRVVSFYDSKDPRTIAEVVAAARKPGKAAELVGVEVICICSE